MHKSTILIVEDNEILTLELKDRLESINYTVVSTAASGLDAIKKAELHHPDLIIMDIKIKGDMDGIDTASAIRKDKDIPIIFLTAHADDKTLQRAIITQPYGYIIKPFDEKELKSSIEMALYNHSLEKKLKESEENFRLVFEFASIGNSLTSIEGKFINVNETLCKMLGYSKNELFSGNFNAYTHPDDIASSHDCFTNLLCGALDFCEFEKRYIKKDGSIIWIHLNSKLLRDSKGNPLYFITNFNDITEQKHSQESIRKSEERFRKIFEDHSAIKILTDPDTGKIVDANISAAEFYGWTCDELKQMDISQISTLPLKEIRREMVSITMKGKNRIEFQHKLKDGSIREVNVFSSRIEIDGKDYLHSIIFDITEQKLAEQKLQRSQQLLSLHIKQTPLAFIEFDNEGYVRKWNPSAVKIFGYQQKEAIGQYWDFIVPENLRLQLNPIWDALINQHGDSRSSNLNVTKDGKEIICQWYNAPLVDPSGKTMGVASLIMDITERTRIENELKEQMNKITRFNKLMIGREHKMIELKKEINMLLESAGKPQKYKIHKE
jgi:PAS domain S-box-containing protein